MSKAIVVVASVSSVLVASVAFACGGAPPMPSPGYTGTTVSEHGGTVSKFIGNAQGYQWERVDLTTQQVTELGEVPGHFSGSVETDVRVSSGIAGQNGKMVRFTADAVTPLSDDPAAQVDVFGAALSGTQQWNVFTYDAASQTISWFFESSLGRFDKAGTLAADCGQVLMLDVVAEDSGAIEGLCGGVSFEVEQGALRRVELPVEARSLSLGSDGKAIAYGPASKTGGLQRMRHDATGWVKAGLIETPRADVVYALDDKSVLIRTEAGFTGYTLHELGWNASKPLGANTAVTSAGGHPAKVLSGSFDLTLWTNDGSKDAEWSATSLGALGQPPQSGGGFHEGGCSIVGTALPFALLGLMSMSRFRRRFAKK